MFCTSNQQNPDLIFLPIIIEIEPNLSLNFDFITGICCLENTICKRVKSQKIISTQKSIKICKIIVIHKKTAKMRYIIAFAWVALPCGEKYFKKNKNKCRFVFSIFAFSTLY